MICRQVNYHGMFHAAALVSMGLIHVVRVCADDGSSTMQLLKESHLAAKVNLKSGIGRGFLEIYRGKIGSKEWELVIKAKVQIRFNGGKYLISLDYETDKVSRLDSRRIVFDGTTLVVNQFSNRIKPKGAEAQILPHHEREGAPSNAGFPFDPSNLPDEMTDVTSLCEKYGDKVHFTSTKEGKSLGAVTMSMGESYTFEATPSSGHHVTSWQVALSNGQVHTKANAEWRRSGNVWYVQSITKETDFGESERYREVLKYDYFEPNASVGPESFWLDALELPTGARILDQRPGAEVPIYRTTSGNSTSQSQLDGILEEIKALAVQPQTRKPSLLRIGLAACGILLSIIGILALWRRSLTRARSRS